MTITYIPQLTIIDIDKANRDALVERLNKEKLDCKIVAELGTNYEDVYYVQCNGHKIKVSWHDNNTYYLFEDYLTCEDYYRSETKLRENRMGLDEVVNVVMTRKK